MAFTLLGEIKKGVLGEKGGRQGAGFWGTSLMMIFPFWWIVLLLTMLTMATPRLQRIPKEMQKPRPLSTAMMYLRGSPKQVQSHRGARRSWSARGLPSSVNSMASPVCCFFSSRLHHTHHLTRALLSRKRQIVRCVKKNTSAEWC